MRHSGTIDVQVGDEDVLITMRGEVDIMVTTEFDMVDALADTAGRPVHIDLGEVTFMDSCGIAQLLTARNFTREVHLISPPPEVTRLLSLSGITNLFGYERR